MSSRVHRVLVIQDASRELSADPIRSALHSLSLKSGDRIKFLRIVQPFRKTNNRSPLLSCGILVSKSRLHSSATILKRQESIDREIRKKLAEFETNNEMKSILLLMRNQQIEIERAVEPGHSLKKFTVQAANNIDATCVILDRKLRREIKYIMENLTCGILRMRKDGGVKCIRAPKAPEPEGLHPYQIQANHQFTSEQQPLHNNSICSVCSNTRHTDENAREFTLEELQRATAGFSEQNILSNNHKLIYKGVLNDRTMIVVSSRGGETTSDMQFRNRVQLLGKARHKNVVGVLGSYSEGLQRLLVCDYVCNGSLNRQLSDRCTGLTWKRRIYIALGSARGLQYLHRKSFYGSMRPENILLTHDYEPLLTNYGVTRDQYQDMDRSSGTRVLKTFDYLAPEYAETVIHSSKTDVYSFGVVLLQLITGWKTLKDTNGRSLLTWATPLLREKNYPDLLDRAIGDSYDLVQLFWMVRITEKCLATNPYRRYSIDQVVNALCQIAHGYSVTDYSPPESESETEATATM
ncbi:putative serine/threonine-protein kinase PBL7 isoform X1 [Apium graveolens]|uniref:putative serine/threonine-protein kinase PBL7 isoform X1 n=2 Tax=Apium graveolens TaxID=4045 RepID=UPI003D79D66E